MAIDWSNGCDPDIAAYLEWWVEKYGSEEMRPAILIGLQRVRVERQRLETLKEIEVNTRDLEALAYLDGLNDRLAQIKTALAPLNTAAIGNLGADLNLLAARIEKLADRVQNVRW